MVTLKKFSDIGTYISKSQRFITIPYLNQHCNTLWYPWSPWLPIHPWRSVAVRDYERKARSALRFFIRTYLKNWGPKKFAKMYFERILHGAAESLKANQELVLSQKSQSASRFALIVPHCHWTSRMYGHPRGSWCNIDEVKWRRIS